MTLGRTVAVLVLLAGGSVGCHKKASPAECEKMVAKFAELVVTERMQDAGPEIIAAERARELAEAKTDDAFKNCPSEVQTSELGCAMKAESSAAFLRCLE